MQSNAHTPPFFFFNDTATTEIYTLSLHDALPICVKRAILRAFMLSGEKDRIFAGQHERSEEHTSELQSHLNLVCRLLLEKKKPGSPATPTAKRRLYPAPGRAQTGQIPPHVNRTPH